MLEQFSVINAAATKNWLAASDIWLIADPPFLSNFIPADFFLFPKANGQLTEKEQANREDACQRGLLQAHDGAHPMYAGIGSR